MLIDLNTILVSAISGIIVGIITIYLSPKINHKYELKAIKEKWKFEWKVNSFTNFVNEINRKIEFYETIIKKCQYDKDFNKENKDIVKQIDNEILYNKNNADNFYLLNNFSSEILKINMDFNESEMIIGIKLKQGLKNNKSDLFIEASAELMNLHLYKNRLLKEMYKQIENTF